MTDDNDKKKDDYLELDLEDLDLDEDQLTTKKSLRNKRQHPRSDEKLDLDDFFQDLVSIDDGKKKSSHKEKDESSKNNKKVVEVNFKANHKAKPKEDSLPKSTLSEREIAMLEKAVKGELEEKHNESLFDIKNIFKQDTLGASISELSQYLTDALKKYQDIYLLKKKLVWKLKKKDISKEKKNEMVKNLSKEINWQADLSEFSCKLASIFLRKMKRDDTELDGVKNDLVNLLNTFAENDFELHSNLSFIQVGTLLSQSISEIISIFEEEFELYERFIAPYHQIDKDKIETFEKLIRQRRNLLQLTGFGHLITPFAVACIAFDVISGGKFSNQGLFDDVSERSSGNISTKDEEVQRMQDMLTNTEFKVEKIEDSMYEFCEVPFGTEIKHQKWFRPVFDLLNGLSPSDQQILLCESEIFASYYLVNEKFNNNYPWFRKSKDDSVYIVVTEEHENRYPGILEVVKKITDVINQNLGLNSEAEQRVVDEIISKHRKDHKEDGPISDDEFESIITELEDSNKD